MVDLARQKNLVGFQERHLTNMATKDGAWLDSIPRRLNGAELSQEELWDIICLRYGLMDQYIPTTCDGCGKKLLIEHALLCPKGGLVIEWHDNAENYWSTLGCRSLTTSDIYYGPKINISTVHRESTGAGVLREGKTADGSMNVVGEAQGDKKNISTRYRASELGRDPGQVAVPSESRSGVSAHSFWKRGNTAMCDIRIVNLDTVSYLCVTPKKSLEKAEKYKKDKYLQACPERWRYFIPMVYSAGKIPDQRPKRHIGDLLHYSDLS